MSADKPMSFAQADKLARSECARLACDIYIYRLRNGKFRVTSNTKTIPCDASIHATFGLPIQHEATGGSR